MHVASAKDFRYKIKFKIFWHGFDIDMSSSWKFSDLFGVSHS